MTNLPKIYFVANVRMPTDRAHGIQLIKMCEAFLEAGRELELVVPRRKNANGAGIKEYYGLKMQIPVKKIFTPDFYRFGGIGFNISSFFFGISYFILLLFKKLKGEKFIVYTVDLDHFSFLPLAFLGVPYFIEIHGEKKKTFLHRIFFRRAGGIVAINDFMKKNLIKNYKLPANKIDVRPNGIDLEKFDLKITQEKAKEKLNLPQDKKLILYVGRLYDWKGFDVLFSAASLLPKDYLLYFIGGEKKEADKFAGKNKIPEGIIFAGVKNPKEIPLWLAAADALLLLGTAKNEASFYYTSPMKLFEYMASHRPVVASRTPANEKIISSDEVYFYEPDDPKSLVAKINEVSADVVLARAKSDRAYAKVSGFSWSKRADRILSFIGNNIE